MHDALIKVFFVCRKLKFTTFVRRVSGKELGQKMYGLAADENSSGTTEISKASGRPRSVRTSKCRKTWNLWRSSSALMQVLCTSTKVRTKLKRKQTFRGRLFGALQSTILQLKIYSGCQGLLSFARWRHFIFENCFK